MSGVISTDDNLNPASNNSFILVFTDTENPGSPVQYFARGVTLPGYSMPGVGFAYKNSQGSLPNNTRDKDDLSVEFLVSENLKNYKFFRRWAQKGQKGAGYIEECFKDIALIFLDSNKQPIDTWRYLAAFPTNVSQLSLEHGVMDNMPLTFTVNFAFAEEDWDE